MFTKNFTQVTQAKNKIAIVGGKAASLVTMTQNNIPVPNGFVIDTTAFEHFLAYNQLTQKIETLTRSASNKNSSPMAPVAKQIHGLIMHATVPQKMQQEIFTQFELLHTQRVSVRSSATAEDSSQSAWAGQLESFLNIPRADVITQVKKCWASLFTIRALTYRLQKNVSKQPIAIAVIVQKMIPSAASGIAFSMHPTTNAQTIMIEAGLGLGEALVSGRISPDTYTVTKKQPLRISGKNISTQQKALHCLAKGKTVWKTINKKHQKKQKIEDTDILSIAQLVIQLEKLFSCAVDVEWAKQSGKIYILQCRPITTTEQPATSRSYTWSNANTAEVLPGTNPPLVSSTMLSIVDPVLRAIFHIPKKIPMLREIKGHLYFNMSVIEESFTKIVKTKDFSVTKFIGGTDTNPNANVLKRITPRGICNMALFSMSMLLRSLYAHRLLKKEVCLVKKQTARFHTQIASATQLHELLNIQQNILVYINKNFRLAILGLLYPLSYYFLFTTLCKKWCKDDKSNLAHALLADGKTKLQFIQAFHDLWNISRAIKRSKTLASRFLQSKTTAEAENALSAFPQTHKLYTLFLKKYGYRTVKELDFSLPRWQEDPSFILSMLKTYLQSSPKRYAPTNKARYLRKQQRVALRFLEQSMPRWKLVILKKILPVAKQAQYEREFAKAEFVRLLVPLREVFLRIGTVLHKKHILHNPHDIFFCTNAEIQALNLQTISSADFSKIISARKNEYKTNTRLRLPAVITDQELHDNNFSTTTEKIKQELKGIAVSHGIAQGAARVIRSVTEIHLVKPGEILVTDHTDPGWTPVFVTIAGLVTNTGGLLSHAAIVAREYGLPAVVNVSGATEQIHTGQIIRVDSNTGIVNIINKIKTKTGLSQNKN